MRFHIHLLPVFLAVLAHAAKPLGDQVCVATCYNALLKAKFAAATNKAQMACTNPLRVKSTYYCISEHCARESDAATEDGIEWWAEACKNSSKVVNVKSYHAAVSNVTEAYLAGLPRVDQKAKQIFNGSALPSNANWKYMHTTVFLYADARRYNDAIRWSMYGFWGLVILVGVCNRLWSLVSSRRHKRAPVEPQTGELSAPRKALKWWKINLLQSPTISHHHHEPWGWWTLPLRIHTVVIALYILLHILVVATRYRVVDENDYFKSRRTQALRWIADRLGTLMAASMPFIFLFGARSSPLPIITGWSYRTFSNFHRWVALVMLVESIAHGCVFSAYYAYEKGFPDYRNRLQTDVMFRSGIFMLTAMGVSVAFAHIKIRQMAYELFKIAHIAMGIIFLANYWDHIKDKFGGDYRVWTWVCVGIWASDYFFRLVRIVWLNFNALIGKDNRAIASYSEDTGMIRLHVHASGTGPHSHQNPGTYYYLHFGGWRIWENHPFSLAGSSAGDAAPQVTTTTQVEGEKSPATVVSSSGQQELLLGGQSYKTFMIRPRSGFTRRLRDAIVKQDAGGVSRLRVVLEGPYGTGADISGFNEILFVAGGSGITAVLPYTRHIFEDRAAEDPRPPSVRLVWVVRQEGFARDVLANDLRAAVAEAAGKLRVDVYVTASRGSGEDSGSEEKTDPEKSDQENTMACDAADSGFAYGRPVVAEVVGEYVAGLETNRAAVFVCGPARMADEVRAAVRREARSSTKDLGLFEEMYGW
ncbi:ferric-chelate reductase [Cordyceps fumosorosea ARSEF 2679]|uniref:Ferric-chelate reductase n=1 Tax=Cordyceps fumosorosea (strain ARSEF 2679) TaxID=1081104 RepID=A0A167SVX5_CORFA|nr:ferric-chelate reductase [Cordyceps fumosorosea ARSEF 2679]OAA59979.1 ferric-chelate reductase [Cordyceps fumosorosea ARSEF 2679]